MCKQGLYSMCNELWADTRECKSPCTGWGVCCIICQPLHRDPGNLYPRLHWCGNTYCAEETWTTYSARNGLLVANAFDTDTIINRTLVYGLLTLILVLVYLGLVFSGQSLLTSFIGTNNGIVIVTSTLIVAILFQPLRYRLQSLIDRRFYRRKYDAARTLQSFSAILYKVLDVFCAAYFAYALACFNWFMAAWAAK